MNNENLVPFKKGDDERRNITGANKGVTHSKKRLLKILSLIQIKKNPFTGADEEFSVAEQMDIGQVIKALKGDTKAYHEVIDRLEGRASETIDVTTGGEKITTPIITAIIEGKIIDGKLK